MPEKDLYALGNSSMTQTLKEYITPHKIAIAILIQEFCFLKTKSGYEGLCRTESPDLQKEIILEPRDRTDFWMLLLKLIQCPDMEYHELMELIDSNKYQLKSILVINFKKELKSLASQDVGSIINTILSLGRFIDESTNNVPPLPLVNKSSVVGIFLRRVQLFFDKLSFAQLVGTCKAYKKYIYDGLNPSTAYEKEFVGETKINLLTSTPQPPHIFDSSDINSDMSCDISVDVFHDAICTPQAVHRKESIFFLGRNIKDDKTTEAVAEAVDSKYNCAMWSRKQAELFIAQQVGFIQSNDTNAMPPPQLQKMVNDVIKANPDHSEAHYLSYLNCLRVKEVCGATDSLHHYFDRISAVSEEKNKGYRYAALNNAILHAQFGQTKAALDALKEVTILAHEAKDNLCLQYAQAWMYKFCGEEKKEFLIEKSISKCYDLSMYYLTTFGLQSYAKYVGLTGGKPSLVLEVLMRSDLLNCNYNMPDMFGLGFAHKAALWSLYGKSEMAALSSNMLLHLDTSDLINTQNPDGSCQTICNVANIFINYGEYKLALVVLDQARVTYPNSPWWLIMEQILYFTQALYEGNWQLAHNAVLQLSSLDKWESDLRLAELLLAKGDNHGVIEAVSPIIDSNIRTSPHLMVRALILHAKANPCSAANTLTDAYSIAAYHFLDYLLALVLVELANVQLKMSLATQALKLVDKALINVQSHGSLYDQAYTLVLFAECKIAAVSFSGNDGKLDKYSECIQLLEKAKANFKKVGAYSKAKETVYLQALLSHELSCNTERNKYAFEFRQLDELYPTK